MRRRPTYFGCKSPREIAGFFVFKQYNPIKLLRKSVVLTILFALFLSPLGWAVEIYTYQKDGEGNLVGFTVSEGNEQTVYDTFSRPRKKLIHPTPESPYELEILYDDERRVREVYRDGALALKYSYFSENGKEITHIRNFEKNRIP